MWLKTRNGVVLPPHQLSSQEAAGVATLTRVIVLSGRGPTYDQSALTIPTMGQEGPWRLLEWLLSPSRVMMALSTRVVAAVVEGRDGAQ
jgi:hypothetical protein